MNVRQTSVKVWPVGYEREARIAALVGIDLPPAIADAVNRMVGQGAISLAMRNRGSATGSTYWTRKDGEVDAYAFSAAMLVDSMVLESGAAKLPDLGALTVGFRSVIEADTVHIHQS